MFDYHVHSDCSFDSFETMGATCAAAVRAGVTEIAFTEHVDFSPDDQSTGYYDADRYRAALAAARAEWGDRLTILSGAEVDFNTNWTDQTRAFLDGHRFDFVIGSVHFFVPAGGGAAEMVYPEIYEGRATDEVYAGYLEQIRAAAATGWFDTIGHIDFPKRYPPADRDDYDPVRYRPLWDAIFAELIRTGTAFEINTSGLRKVTGASLPGPAVVRWYAEAGGRRVTIGSDTHEAATIGSGIRTTLAMLRLCGLDEVLSFRERQPTPVSIERLLGRVG